MPRGLTTLSRQQCANGRFVGILWQILDESVDRHISRRSQYAANARVDCHVHFGEQQIFGFRPRDRVTNEFCNQQRIRPAVCHKIGGPSFRSAPHCFLSNDRHVIGRRVVVIVDRVKSIDRGHLLQQTQIFRTVPRLVQIKLLIEFVVANIRQEQNSPTQQGLSVFTSDKGRRKVVTIIDIVGDRQPELFEISLVA